MQRAAESSRLYKLEALRGIASIIVMLYHYKLGFFPNENIVDGTPAYFLVNGTASVMFFFTLSGFVLTIKYFKTEDLKVISTGSAKRYFRLLGPVFVTILICYLLFFFNLYFFERAGNISHSEWLRS